MAQSNVDDRQRLAVRLLASVHQCQEYKRLGIAQIRIDSSLSKVECLRDLEVGRFAVRAPISTANVCWRGMQAAADGTYISHNRVLVRKVMQELVVELVGASNVECFVELGKRLLVQTRLLIRRRF